MNEDILKEISDDISAEELAELDSMPPFKPSLRHKLAMKRIFAKYEKNIRKAHAAAAPTTALSVLCKRSVKKLVIIFAVIVCAATLTGAVVVYVSKNFHGNVYSDNTHLFAVNTEGCPTVIEHEYYLSEVPEGYEIIERISTRKSVHIQYENKATGHVISFAQYTKEAFKMHYNTEHQSFEDIEVNGHAGLCLDFSNEEHHHSLIVWDSGDYVLEIIGEISKSDILKLAKSAKPLKI